MTIQRFIKRNLILIATIAASLILFSSCATHSTEVVEDLPGFWSGLLHGFISLFSFIGSLFTDYKMYSIPNAGGWYDGGFLLGVSIFFGGGGSRACKK